MSPLVTEPRAMTSEQKANFITDAEIIFGKITSMRSSLNKHLGTHDARHTCACIADITEDLISEIVSIVASPTAPEPLAIIGQGNTAREILP